MTEKTRVSRTPGTPDRSVAQDLLNRHWEAVLQDDTLQATSEIAAIVNSSLVTVRYCLPTQLLGKLADRSLDALCLQARNKAPGLWDPRSFAAEVIAPWVLRNQKVLGNSADPYVGNRCGGRALIKASISFQASKNGQRSFRFSPTCNYVTILITQKPCFDKL